jgi:hypothetical protein
MNSGKGKDFEPYDESHSLQSLRAAFYIESTCADALNEEKGSKGFSREPIGASASCDGEQGFMRSTAGVNYHDEGMAIVTGFAGPE